MKLKTIRTALITAFLISSAPAISDDQKVERGWHWYDLPPDVVERIEQEIEHQVEKKVKEELDKREQANQPPVGSSAWISQNIKRFKQQAADNPTTDNIRATMYLERIMYDRANRLARRSEMVAQSDPILENGFNSTSNLPQSRARQKEADIRRGQFIQDLTDQDKVIVLSFIKPDCKLCEMQVNSLAELTRQHGVPILFILKDGAEPPKYPYEENAGNWDYSINGKAGDLIPVIGYPTSYAFNTQTGEYSLLGQGHIPLTSFEQRIVMAADYAGWATPEEVEATRYNPRKIRLSNIKFDGVESDLNDPVQFLNFIESQLYGKEQAK